MIKNKILIIIVLSPILFFGQLTVINPGLEGPTGWGITPDPWQNCMPFGFFVAGYGEYATPDTQPGTFYVTLPASEGDSYIGFGHITPYIGIAGLSEFQEGFGQELSSPMIANGCPYIFTIDLANGLTPDIWADPPPIETTIGEVRVFGGFDLCSEEELLWSSGPITNEDWETYTVEFTPNDNYSHILFECFKVEEEAECGYVLADNITPIINAPPISNAGENQEICENSTNLNANILEENESGTWSITSGNGVFQDINNPNTQVTELDIGENIFQWTVLAECTDEIGVSQVSINLYNSPLINAGEDEQICESFYNLSANIPNDNETGFWSIISGNADFEDINNPNTLITNLNENENIFEWTISSLFCQEISDQVIINYIESNLNANAGENINVCEQETNLNANTPNDNEVGSWNVISGNAFFANMNNPNTIVTNMDIGINVFEWTISDACESVSSQVTVNVEVIDVIIDEISNYNGTNTSCNNNNDGFIDLTTIGGYFPYTYNWFGPDEFTSNNEDINGLSSGLYECLIIDNLGCEKTISILIEEPSPIEIELISFSDMNCFDNAHIDFNATGGTGTLEGIISTSWGDTTTFIWNTTNEWYFDYDNFSQWDGEINVTVIDINGCTIISENVSVTTWEDPISDFETSTFNTNISSPIFFSDASVSHSPIINWLWDFGDGNISNSQNPTHIYEQEGQYIICLEIEDANGCKAKKCNIINIYSNSYAYIPNVFTVNNDNINESFKPIISGIIQDSYKMLIYDRWGKLLFATTNYLEGWDGKYETKTLNAGVYSYKINYLTISGEEQTHIGKITLVK